MKIFFCMKIFPSKEKGLSEVGVGGKMEGDGTVGLAVLALLMMALGVSNTCQYRVLIARALHCEIFEFCWCRDVHTHHASVLCVFWSTLCFFLSPSCIDLK